MNDQKEDKDELSFQKEKLFICRVRKSKRLKSQLNSIRWNISPKFKSNSNILSPNKILNILKELFQERNMRQINTSTAVVTKRQQPVKDNILNYNIVCKNNNYTLIEKLLKKRFTWEASLTSNLEHTHFIWGTVPFERARKMNREQMISRIPRSNQLTDKGRLYQNITDYANKYNKDLKKIVPKTFHFCLSKPLSILRHDFRQLLSEMKEIQLHSKLQNIWILKPTSLNQGRQIELFSSVEMLRTILQCCSNLHGLNKINQNKSASVHVKRRRLLNTIQNKFIKEDELFTLLLSYIKKDYSIIIQKYIQNPYLIEGRKFDMRVWALVDHNGNVYMYEEGYLRLSSEEYGTNKQTLMNHFIHLTNHTLQKNSEHYSKDLNIQPLSRLQEYLKTHSYTNLISQIEYMIATSIKACFSKMRKEELRCKCFEIYGFDLMIDSFCNLILIQVNCNPAITEDNAYLKIIVPKMIDHTFQITVDKHFGYKSNFSNQNLWKHLCKIGDPHQIKQQQSILK